MELDRRAILVHLKDLRDLEVAKYQIEHVVYVREERNFKNKYSNLEQEYNKLTRQSASIQESHYADSLSETDYNYSYGGCSFYIWIGCLIFSFLSFCALYSDINKIIERWKQNEMDINITEVMHFLFGDISPFLMIIFSLIIFLPAFYSIIYFIILKKDIHQYSIQMKKEIHKKTKKLKNIINVKKNALRKEFL